ncbi:MAG: nucleotide exchange factor GrpE [bacterium]
MTEHDKSALDAQDEIIEESPSDEHPEGASDEPSAPEESDGPAEVPAPDAAMDSLFVSPEDSDVEVVMSEAVASVPDAVVEELRAKLLAAETERDEAKNRYLRTAADLENFRKRTAREKEDMRKYGIDKVVLELLPVIDNLDRALDHAEKSETNTTSIVDGVRMVYRQFLTSLEKHGVTSFDAKGQHFDPTKHEAIQQVETPEFDTGTVLEQYQKGYFLHDRLIRPALVAVAKKVESNDNVEQADTPVEPIDVATDGGTDEQTTD